MPSKETVITPTEPTLGNRGAAEVPDSIKFDDKLIHTPKVESEELNNMLRSDGQVGGLYRILTTPLRGAKILVVPKKIGNRTGNREANFIREVLTYPYAEGGMDHSFADCNVNCAKDANRWLVSSRNSMGK